VTPTAADNPSLSANYPVLPARRRFWERVKRVATSGTAPGNGPAGGRVPLAWISLILSLVARTPYSQKDSVGRR